MNTESMVTLCDLFELYDQCDYRLECVIMNHLDEPTVEATVAYHRTLKQNIILGEALLEKISEEFETASMPGICDFPFAKISLQLQKDIAESQDTMRRMERKYEYLPRPHR